MNNQLEKIVGDFQNKGGRSFKLTANQIKRIEDGDYNIKLTKNQIETLKNTITGGALPLLALIPAALKIISALGAAGAAAGGVATVVNAVNTKKHQKNIEAETNRHNLKVEKGEGLYLKPYSGTGLKKACKCNSNK